MSHSRTARQSRLFAASLAIAFTSVGACHAASRQTFIIPQSDGYGIGECFSEGRDCARVVADAWCEAHGNGHAIAYGRAEDTTASIISPASSDAGESQGIIPGSIVISCGE